MSHTQESPHIAGPHEEDEGLAPPSTVDEPRMYQLVRQRGGAAGRSFEITFLDPGVRAYVFTFGW